MSILDRFSIPVMYTSVCIFLFSALSLVIPGGYVYGPLFLVLGSISLLFSESELSLFKSDWLLIGALLLYFFVNVISNVVHHLPLNSYDRPLRFLLAIPAYLLLVKYSPKASFFWGGLAFGVLGALVLASYERYFTSGAWWRPGGFMNSIQFGDISLLMGGLLLPAMLFAFSEQKRYFFVAMVIFLSGIGFLASFLSWSRGGWLAIPVILFICLKMFNFSAVKIFLILLGVGFCSILIVFYVLPESNFLKERISQTFFDLNSIHDAAGANTSVGVRMQMWHIGIQAFYEKPVLGWGDLASIKSSFTGPWSFIAERDNYNHLHNEYIDELAKRGIVGFVGLALLYAVPLTIFLARINSSALNTRIFAFTGLLHVSSCMIFGLTQVFMSHNSGAIVFLFYLIILVAMTRETEVA